MIEEIYIEENEMVVIEEDNTSHLIAVKILKIVIIPCTFVEYPPRR